MGRLIDADLLVLEEQSLEDLGQDKMEFYSPEQIDNAPTVKAVTIEQLEEMYDDFERALWREREDVRGADMIEIGYAEQFLQEFLCMFGCWDEEQEDGNDD